jgi:hypothetical protein
VCEASQRRAGERDRTVRPADPTVHHSFGDAATPAGGAGSASGPAGRWNGAVAAANSASIATLGVSLEMKLVEGDECVGCLTK